MKVTKKKKKCSLGVLAVNDVFKISELMNKVKILVVTVCAHFEKGRSLLLFPAMSKIVGQLGYFSVERQSILGAEIVSRPSKKALNTEDAAESRVVASVLCFTKGLQVNVHFYSILYG